MRNKIVLSANYKMNKEDLPLLLSFAVWLLFLIN